MKKKTQRCKSMCFLFAGSCWCLLSSQRAIEYNFQIEHIFCIIFIPTPQCVWYFRKLNNFNVQAFSFWIFPPWEICCFTNFWLCCFFFISAALFIICTHYLFCWQFSTDFILRAFSSVYFSFAFETNNHFKYALNVGLHIHLFYCCVFVSVSLVLHTIWMRYRWCELKVANKICSPFEWIHFVCKFQCLARIEGADRYILQKKFFFWY